MPDNDNSSTNATPLNFSDPELQEKVHVLSSQAEPKDGRPIEELLRSTGSLQGHEALRLRRWFSAHRLDAIHDLNEYGRSLFEGDFARVKADWFGRLAKLLPETNSEFVAREAAVQDLLALRWGETRVPIYTLLLLGTLHHPDARLHLLDIARWLVSEVNLPVEAEDICGSTALYHALSTKPAFDPEFAQILYDAGGDVNHRNRYGATAAHDITLIWEPRNAELVQRAADALAWYLERGGNIDIKDNDGLTARMCVDSTRKLASRGVEHMATWDVVDREDKRRRRMRDEICTFCGRGSEGENVLLVCSRCKKAPYCSPPRQCQLYDWPRHRKLCKPHKPSSHQSASKYFGAQLHE
ncbi:uncharacterized protein LAESUDRAFT_700931 [Laetiporus sulphureus 93-53]|uniref:MYND-type domain-containing protein n=1 Tax=Laetiporus sulphureus 93-53 TaxID=1314785 RepID=A0A165E1D2_9APHY|nr:uncharacterized protein LAESUDRAFT_700931 [Laetiporus sulphureus 93-53]KZT06061.1 hypothetical protein LAESUDRAFT_700931 [Laetiporus sulphureus 93-53]